MLTVTFHIPPNSGPLASTSSVSTAHTSRDKHSRIKITLALGTFDTPYLLNDDNILRPPPTPEYLGWQDR